MPKDFSGSTVLITGADGFIGSHLTELLVSRGAKVTALVLYNSWNEIGWLKDIPSQILREVDLQVGDIRDAERIRALAAGKQYVFHLSSLIAIPYSYLAPRSYVDTNIIGATNVLEACRASDSLDRLVHVSTSEVYGTAQFVPISEEHPLVGQSPYSASKIAADKMAESYHLSFELPLVIARPFNTYGPRQSARAVIPTIASQIAAGKTRLSMGSVTPSRDFNYASDTALGMCALALSDAAMGETINIGSGEEHTIAKVVEILSGIAGVQVHIEQDPERIRPAKSEVDRLLCDNSKITGMTDWRPQVSFADGLARTYEWICRNLQHFDVDRYSR
ncbi:GDP-mannose 4,6-dehydratase [uncultured Devosia sp.]|uniref:GDP-mannose 4,6-dehydratase n=1 Tax=uncultured Devosia sp. TaxID=211434 RepID=UPI00262FE7CF|nr:GDP-mannose 4,6-dehydratase [uncultured Devosia sp.]